MLYIGEKVGRGGEEIDIAVDPLEGTNLTAYGQSNSLAVLAFGPKGTLLHAPDTYMNKVAVGPEAYDAVHIDASPTENVRNVAKALKRDVEDLVVCILDRERHADLIREVRAAGARIRLISDGDVFGAVATADRGHRHPPLPGHRRRPRGRARVRGDEVHRRLLHGPLRVAQRRGEGARGRDGHAAHRRRSSTMDTLVNTDEAAFIATGVTDGEMLQRCEVLRERRAHQLGGDGREVQDRPLHRHDLPHRAKRSSGCGWTSAPGPTEAARREGRPRRSPFVSCRAWTAATRPRGSFRTPAMCRPPRRCRVLARRLGGLRLPVVGVVEPGALEVDADRVEQLLHLQAALGADDGGIVGRRADDLDDVGAVRALEVVCGHTMRPSSRERGHDATIDGRRAA